MIGLNNSILLVRVDSLDNFSHNHYDIIDPKSPSKLIIICNIVGYPYSQYNPYVVNNGKMSPVSMDFVPSSKQIVLFLNKNINQYDYTKVFKTKIIQYLKQRVKIFLDLSLNENFDNISYPNYRYLVSPNL